MLDWSKYTTVANRYQCKAKHQDKDDLNHTIVLSLAQAQTRLDNDGGGELTDIAMLRIASCRAADYWRSEYRNSRIASLNQEYDDGDGNTTELMDTVADDKAIDLVAWQDARTWILGCPKRLIVIAGKRHKGIPLNKTDARYLERYRRREQLKLA
jgi:hypothetical protein